MYNFFQVVAFLFSIAMFGASLAVWNGFRKQGNTWAAVGGFLYVILSIIACWGILK